jgi:hypothetical protein
MTPTQFITACYRMASYYGITLPDTMTEGDAVRAMHYAGVDHPGDTTAMVAPRLWDAETIKDAPEGPRYAVGFDGIYLATVTKEATIAALSMPGSFAYGPLPLPVEDDV